MDVDEGTGDLELGIYSAGASGTGTVRNTRLVFSKTNCSCADYSRRPSDLRGALNAIATSTLNKAKKAEKAKPTKHTTKPAATASSTIKAKAKKKAEDGDDEDDDDDEVYHFIGYVPAYGKVWELDGLKTGPLEVGELADGEGEDKTWMDVVRPALRRKMQKNNIRFSLLALVDGVYERASDELEFRKRERMALQRRMPEGWESRVRFCSVNPCLMYGC